MCCTVQRLAECWDLARPPKGDCELTWRRDDTVFAGGGLSLVKVQLQFQEGVAKVCPSTQLTDTWWRIHQPPAAAGRTHTDFVWKSACDHALGCDTLAGYWRIAASTIFWFRLHATRNAPGNVVLQVGEAAKFFSRGIRLLVSDVGNSSRLFMKAAFGASPVLAVPRDRCLSPEGGVGACLTLGCLVHCWTRSNPVRSGLCELHLSQGLGHILLPGQMQGAAGQPWPAGEWFASTTLPV